MSSDLTTSLYLANDRRQAIAMKKPSKLAKSTEEQGVHSWGTFPFPSSNRLVITTTKGVYNWDDYGLTEIFCSRSEGIVAAKKVASEMLAVADSQVVVLHDIAKEMQKSYRLKGSEVRVPCLCIIS